MLQIILVGGQNHAKRSNCILSALKRKAEVFKFSLVSLIKSVWTRHGLQKILVIRSQIIYFLIIFYSDVSVDLFDYSFIDQLLTCSF